MLDLKGEAAAEAAWREAGIEGGISRFFDSFALEEPQSVADACIKEGLPFLTPK